MKILLLLGLFVFCLFKLNAQQSVDSAMRFWSMANYITPPPANIPAGLNMGVTPGFTNSSWFWFATCDTGIVNLEVYFYFAGNCNTIPCNDSAGINIYGPFPDTSNISSAILQLPPDFSTLILPTTSSNIYDINRTYNKGIYYILITTTDSLMNFDLRRTSPQVALMDPTCSVCNTVTDLNQAKICLITLDSVVNRNQIIFDKGETDNISHFNIYRENSVLNQFDSIGWVHVDSLNIYTDLSANPGSRAWRYKIASVDVCGNTKGIIAPSALSPSQTLFLQQGVSTTNTINLSWNSGIQPGYGFYTTYFIYRGDAAGNFSVYDSVPLTMSVYTDVNPLPGINQYYVTLRKINPCILGRSSSEAGSNIISTMFTSLAEYNTTLSFSVYPNPAAHELAIKFGDFNSRAFYSVMDIQGKNVLTGEVESGQAIDISKIESGLYFLEIKSGIKTGKCKIVFQ